MFRIAASHVLILAFTVIAASAADAPKIERIVPAGAQRGTDVEVSLPGKPGDGPLQIWSNRGELTFRVHEEKDAAKVTVPAEAALGLHWIRFYNTHGASKLIPFVVGTIAEAAEVEPNDRISEATAVDTLPTTVNGVLAKSGEVDVYAFEATAGTTLVASVDAHRSLKSPMDAVMQLLDSSGTVRMQNDDDHGFDPQITYEVTTSGLYFVRLFAFPATPNSTINFAGGSSYLYRLTLTTGPFVDHAYPAAASEDEPTAIELRGWNLPDRSQRISVAPFTAPMTSIDVSTALPLTIFSKPYKCMAEFSVVQKQLNWPLSLTGLISAPGEADQYTFDAEKGQQLTVSVLCERLHSPLDPVLTVLSGDGKVLKEIDDTSRDSRDAEAEIKISADGRYSVHVTDRFAHGGPRFVYLMDVHETVPTFQLTVKNNQFVLTGGKDLEIVVAVNRETGFAEAITVSVEGLPPGMSVETVVSEAKGDSAKSVKLTLKRDAEVVQPFSGILHIVGTAQDSDLKRTATAPIGDSASTTTQLWLTATPSD